MDKLKNYLKLSVPILLMTTLCLSLYPANSEAFTLQIIQKGATGDDVVELQARLQYIGYHTGKIDGVYGWGTYWSVRNFQNDFGLDVDGLVGKEMKRKLEQTTHFDYDYVHGKIDRGEEPKTYGPDQGPDDARKPGQRDPGKAAPDPAPAPKKTPPAEAGKEVGQAEKAVNIPEGFSENDIQLMSNAVYGEGRGEPYEGQVAIAAVIINRVKDSRFPNSISDVIFEPLAFTAVADGQIYMTPDETAKRAVMDAVNGWDPSGGLVYYFNPDTATSAWMFQRERVKKIGKHWFLK